VLAPWVRAPALELVPAGPACAESVMWCCTGLGCATACCGREGCTIVWAKQAMENGEQESW